MATLAGMSSEEPWRAVFFMPSAGVQSLFHAPRLGKPGLMGPGALAAALDRDVHVRLPSPSRAGKLLVRAIERRVRASIRPL